MKTFDELIEAEANKYDSTVAEYDYMTVFDSFKAGAKFVSENPTMIPAVAELVLDLEDCLDDVACTLDNMQHYFENKCCPTSDEVNQCSFADSKLRYAIAKIKRLGEVKEMIQKQNDALKNLTKGESDE